MAKSFAQTLALRQQQRIVDAHYRRLADNYDRFLYYSQDFIGAVSARVIEALDLKPSDRFVDLGCGTGMYTVEIAKRVQFSEPVYAVDPYIEMLNQVPLEKGMRTIMMDALIFSRQTMGYDKILMKESVHHVTERPALFRNLFRRLPRQGRLLLIGVPPEIDYPLFDAALERSRVWHADPNVLTDELQDVGFSVGIAPFTYEHAIPKDTYFKMVRARYMSLLSTFSDEEIEQGISEMRNRHASLETLRFTDRFHFVLGVKDK